MLPGALTFLLRQSPERSEEIEEALQMEVCTKANAANFGVSTRVVSQLELKH